MTKLMNDQRKTSKENKKTTVAFIFNHPYFLGGGEISFFELIRSLNRDLFKPVIIVPDDGEIKKKLETYKFKVLINPLPSLRLIFLGLPLYQLLKLLILLHKNNVNLIHANGSRACFYAGLSGKILSIPVIWHVREVIKDSFIYDALLGAVANVIICVSKSVQAKRFERFGKRINNKICVVYNGVDIYKFQNRISKREKIRAKLALRSSDILIGLIGNIVPRKAQDFFLKGFAKAKLNQPDISAKVILIGHYLDKQFSDYLRELATDLGLHSNVIFQEYSDEISDFFLALDIFALTSKSEGFCRSLLEAMSCSLPVIATKISEIEEAVSNGKNAILIDINDIDKMASAIITLYEDSSLRNEMGSLNRNLAVKKFSLASHTVAIENIYKELSKKKWSLKVGYG